MCSCKQQSSFDNNHIYGKPVIPSISQLAKGVVGIAKNVLNIDILPIEVIRNRMSICSKCEYNNRIEGYAQCIKCACIISLKAKLAKESCPLGKW